MGNHYVGIAFDVALSTALRYKRVEDFTTEEALALFDSVGMRKHVRGMDAEFEDLFAFGTEGFTLLCRAFSPGLLNEFPEVPEESDPRFERFRQMYEDMDDQFRRRYEFW